LAPSAHRPASPFPMMTNQAQLVWTWRRVMA